MIELKTEMEASVKNRSNIWVLASIIILMICGVIASKLTSKPYINDYTSELEWGFILIYFLILCIAPFVIVKKTVSVLRRSGHGIPIWVGELERNKTYICRYAVRTPDNDYGPNFKWIACVAENCKNPEERVWKLCCFYEKPGIGEFQLVTGEKGCTKIKFLT